MNKETKYQMPLAEAWWGDKGTDGIVLERIYTKERGVEEIRLAWWKNGNMSQRPADIDASDWPALFETAVKNGVFTPEEKLSMIKALLNN